MSSAAADNSERRQCAFVVPRKQRRCRMQTRVGHSYCGEHAQLEAQAETPANSNDRQRIPCPLDPAHTVDAHKLQKHLKRCPCRVPSAVYIEQGVNVGPASTSESDSDGPVSLQTVIELLRAVQLPDVPVVELSHAGCDAELARPELGPRQRKHLRQQGSLIGHILRSTRHLLDWPAQEVSAAEPPAAKRPYNQPVTFVEFGAGKAQLACNLLTAAPSDCRLLLVERSGTRRKYENKLTDEAQQRVSRVRCGIEHLLLHRVPALDNRRLVGVCKHLCGVATDYALRCLSQCPSSSVQAVCLAPCCHHKCDWRAYTGQHYLRSHGLTTAAHFAQLLRVAAWATCGYHQAAQPTENGDAVHENGENDGENAQDLPTQDDGNQSICNPPEVENDDDENAKTEEKRLELSDDEKLRLGCRAKLLLEVGRSEYLRQPDFGFGEVQLVRYVPTAVTPENLLIIAVKK